MTESAGANEGDNGADFLERLQTISSSVGTSLSLVGGEPQSVDSRSAATTLGNDLGDVTEQDVRDLVNKQIGPETMMETMIRKIYPIFGTIS